MRCILDELFMCVLPVAKSEQESAAMSCDEPINSEVEIVTHCGKPCTISKMSATENKIQREFV